MTASPKPGNLLVRLLPSMQDFAFLMPILFLFGRMDGTRSILGDGDTGWHIRTGEWILAHGRVPHHDIFSFTRPGEPWFAWEWLWDVVFAILHRWGGLALVVLVSMLLISSTSVLLYRLAARRSSPPVAIAVTMLAAASSSIHWLARPHLFTLLFAVIFLHLLDRVAEGRVRLLWFLPALTLVWTNLHGGFFVGILLIGAYALGELAGWAVAQDRAMGLLRRQAGLRYLATAAACLAASFVNPYTFRLHKHVVAYLNDSYQKDHIVEFFSLNFHHPVAPFFELLLLVGAVAAIWHGARGNYRALVMVAVWGHGALIAARNIPIFAIAVTPLLAEALEQWLRDIPSLPAAAWVGRAGRAFLARASHLSAMERVWRLHLVSVAGFAAVAALLYAPAPPRGFRPEFDPNTYPAVALQKVEFTAGSRVFTNDEWGDYLIYRLYPNMRVFVDGRSDFYGRAFEEKYLDVVNVKHNWESILTGYGIDTVLLPAGASLAGALKESSRWRVVYDDGVTLVFRPGHLPAGRKHVSAASGDGRGRDREITKTDTSDRTITDTIDSTT
jgi:hypothetical protein